MKKLKLMFRLLFAKEYILITKNSPYESRIEYSNRHKYPKEAPAEVYAELLGKNVYAVERWLRFEARKLKERYEGCK